MAIKNSLNKILKRVEFIKNESILVKGAKIFSFTITWDGNATR